MLGGVGPWPLIEPRRDDVAQARKEAADVVAVALDAAPKGQRSKRARIADGDLFPLRGARADRVRTVAGNAFQFLEADLLSQQRRSQAWADDLTRGYSRNALDPHVEQLAADGEAIAVLAALIGDARGDFDAQENHDGARATKPIARLNQVRWTVSGTSVTPSGSGNRKTQVVAFTLQGRDMRLLASLRYAPVALPQAPQEYTNYVLRMLRLIDEMSQTLKAASEDTLRRVGLSRAEVERWHPSRTVVVPQVQPNPHPRSPSFDVPVDAGAILDEAGKEEWSVVIQSPDEVEPDLRVVPESVLSQFGAYAMKLTTSLEPDRRRYGWGRAAYGSRPRRSFVVDRSVFDLAKRQIEHTSRWLASGLPEHTLALELPADENKLDVVCLADALASIEFVFSNRHGERCLTRAMTDLAPARLQFSDEKKHELVFLLRCIFNTALVTRLRRMQRDRPVEHPN